MKIYLDCDGVLGDFVGHCVKLFGQTPDELGDPELWRLVNEDPTGFWLNIPVLPGAHELVALAKQYDGVILTGCPYDPQDDTKICSVAQQCKPYWIAKNIDLEIPVITCFSKHKPLYMENPGDILVDDFEKNTTKWEKAGGIAIRYHNAEQALSDLREILR